MSLFAIALIIAVGFGTWIYTKVQQRVGYGNSKAALKTAAVAGLICLVVVFTIELTLFG